MADPYQYEQLLTLLRTYNVASYEERPDGGVKITFFKHAPDPVVVNGNGQVPTEQKGKVAGAGEADNPYHKLFGGNLPTFKREA